MKVQDLTEHYDHKPLSLEIRCPQITVDQSQPLESKYQPAPWDSYSMKTTKPASWKHKK